MSMSIYYQELYFGFFQTFEDSYVLLNVLFYIYIYIYMYIHIIYIYIYIYIYIHIYSINNDVVSSNLVRNSTQ